MSENGFLEQCVKLNVFLEEAHEIAAQVVGPLVKDICSAAPTDHFAGRLDDLIEVALDNTQNLIGQLNKIASRFEGTTPEGRPRQVK